MNTPRILPLLWGCLALVAGWPVRPALGQGATPQTLTWTGADNPALALNTPHPLAATASSGLPVTLRVSFGPATLTGGQITVTGPGLVQVTAEQAGDAAFAAINETRSFNYQQPALTRRGSLTLSGWASGVAIAGHHAYVASGDAGLHVIDLSDPANPRRVGGFNTAGWAVGVVVADNLAYVADSDAGLQIIDVSNPASPVRRGGFNTAGDGLKVAVAGNLAYIADGTSLEVIDVSDPTIPRRVGGLVTSGYAADVQVVGSVAYVADGNGGLQIIDVSDPASPARLGRYNTSGYSSAVQVAGNLAFVADGTEGVQVIDVSNPASPLLAGGIRLPGSSQSVRVVGNLAYVYSWAPPPGAPGAMDPAKVGLRIFDVSNLASPVQVGHDPIDGVLDVQVAGNLVCLARGTGGLQVMEVRVAGPQVLTWTGGDQAILPLNTPYLLNATASSGLPVNYQVSGPATFVDGKLTVTGIGTVTVVAEQAGDATYAAVRATRIFNQRELSLEQRGSIATANLTFDVDVVGDRAYLADWGAGLQVVDVSNPDRPARLSLYNTPGQCFGVDVVDNLAYVADGTQGLQILDISDPANPIPMGSFATAGNAQKVQVIGTVAYVATVSRDLQLIDVSDPTAPTRLAVVAHTGDAVGLKVVGNIAYVAASTAGLHVFDVSNPAMPVRLATVPGLGEATSVDVMGGRAYVVSSTGLHLLDVSNPAAPVRLGMASLIVPGSFGGGIFLPGLPPLYGAVRVVGKLAYVVNGRNLLLIDISNPAQPTRLGTVPVGTDGQGVQVVDSTVYVADAPGGLRIVQARLAYSQSVTWTGTSESILALNTPHPLSATASSGLPVTLRVVSGPATLVNGQLTITGSGTVGVSAEQAGNTDYLPARAARAFNVRQLQFTEVGRIDFTGAGQDMEVVGTRAYTLHPNGFRIVDLSDPGNPAVIGNYQATPQFRRALAAQGTTVFMVAGSLVEIVDASDPANPTLLAQFPVTGSATDVQVAGNLAYVSLFSASNRGGFLVLDVAQPANPVQIGAYEANGGAEVIRVAGGVACVAGPEMGLHVVDVSDPTAPARRSTVAFSGRRVWGMDFSGGLAVVGSSVTGGPPFPGFELIDVSNPAQPVRLGERRAVSGSGGKFQLLGDRLFFFTSFQSGPEPPLQAFDVSHPASPIPIGGHSGGGSFRGVHVAGDTAYVVGQSGLQVLKLRLGYSQSLVWTGPAETLPLLGVGYSLAVTASSGLPVSVRQEFGPATLTGGVLTATGAGLIQVTAEQPGDATFLPVRETRSFNARQARLGHLGELAVAGRGAAAVQVVGNRAYVADQGTDDGVRVLNRAFRILEVSDPARPAQLGSLPLPGQIEAVQVAGNLAYLADGGRYNSVGTFLGGGLRVVDVSDPSNPVMFGGLTTEIGANDVQVVGNLAYLADWEGLRVLDVSNPASPVPVGQLNMPEGTTCLRVVGNHAYVGNWHAGFAVLDVSNPASPVRLGGVDVNSGASEIFVAGHLAYLTTRGNPPRLEVVDISQPTQPVHLGGLTLPGNGEGVRVVGTTAYLAAWDAGLVIADVSNPAVPVLLGSLDTVGVALGVEVAGNLAYVAAGNAGLQVIAVQLSAPHVATPGLRVAAVGGRLELAWPTMLAGAKLQHRQSFAPEHPWQDVTAAPAGVNGELRVGVEASGSAGYFRLFTP